MVKFRASTQREGSGVGGPTAGGSSPTPPFTQRECEFCQLRQFLHSLQQVLLGS